MGRKSGIGSIGMLLALIGGILMLVFGILMIISTVLTEFNDVLAQLSIGNIDLGNISGQPILVGILAIVFGLIVIYSWRENKVSSGDSLLLWGILYIVLWLVLGGGLGGLLVLIGGILLLVDYFT